jgi:hypothetical protein
MPSVAGGVAAVAVALAIYADSRAGGPRRTARPRGAVGSWGRAGEARTLPGMFVRYYVELPLAAARVEEALLASRQGGCRPSPAPPRPAATSC